MSEEFDDDRGDKQDDGQGGEPEGRADWVENDDDGGPVAAGVEDDVFNGALLATVDQGVGNEARPPDAHEIPQDPKGGVNKRDKIRNGPRTYEESYDTNLFPRHAVRREMMTSFNRVRTFRRGTDTLKRSPLNDFLMEYARFVPALERALARVGIGETKRGLIGTIFKQVRDFINLRGAQGDTPSITLPESESVNEIAKRIAGLILQHPTSNPQIVEQIHNVFREIRDALEVYKIASSKFEEIEDNNNDSAAKVDIGKLLEFINFYTTEQGNNLLRKVEEQVRMADQIPVVPQDQNGFATVVNTIHTLLLTPQDIAEALNQQIIRQDPLLPVPSLAEIKPNIR